MIMVFYLKGIYLQKYIEIGQGFNKRINNDSLNNFFLHNNLTSLLTSSPPLHLPACRQSASWVLLKEMWQYFECGMVDRHSLLSSLPASDPSLFSFMKLQFISMKFRWRFWVQKSHETNKHFVLSKSCISVSYK